MKRTTTKLSSCLLFLSLILPVQPSVGSATPDIPPDTVVLEDVESGALLTRTTHAPSLYIPLPALRTDVQISITGIAAHVEVSQTFHNPSNQWLEAVYVFPLPENSAVTRLRMQVADRIIEGVVKEKAEARKEYVKARNQGRKAGLVGQQRPNLFTSSVANIPPGEAIAITLSYQETVSRLGDDYHLRVPLVVGPRYVPPASTVMAVPEANGPAEAIDPPVPALANPHTVPPGAGKVNPVSLRFQIDAGFELDKVTSPYHRIDLSQADGTRASGTLSERNFADRDFELRWRPVRGTAPQPAVFVDEHGGDTYILLMLQPPLPDAAASPARRELILIIDASGSMHGDSIAQALSAVRFALSTLTERDRFNLIHFSDAPTMLFPAPQPAGPAALAQAEHFLSRIVAEGGTNMASALQRAFDSPQDPNALRQLVFLTDGAVANEAALFAMIARGTRDSRLFTVGIGSAPNGYFMRRAARAGRGTFTFIGHAGEVSGKMSDLFERISKPALTDIHLDWRGADIEAGDRPVPDLYLGEPLTLTARVSGFNGLSLRGRYAGQSWSHEVNTDAARPAPWVSTFWARDAIRRLKDELLGGGDREQVRRNMTRIGLEHQLITPYTSLVAVEQRVSRAESDPLHQSKAPVNLPHGWSYEHVFGSLPQTALGWRAQLAWGLALMGLCLILSWLVRANRPSPLSY